ncbi:unnamed protein product, partial [Sphacelaria rigidula]
CAVCSAGYGQGVGNECHLCTGHFKRAMYSLAALATLITFMLTVVVVIYLVGGQGAVRSTKQRTREILGTVGRGRDGAHRGGVDSFSIMVRETATNNDKRHALEEQRPSWEVGAFHDPSSVKTFVKSERDGGTAVPSHLVKPVSEERGNRGLPTSPTATRINGIVGVSPRGGIVSPRGGMQSSQQHYEQPRHNRALAVGDMKNNSTRRRIRIAATAPTGENKDLDDGAPAIARHGKAPGEAGKRTSVTDRIIDLWSKLPLSKLKIVIVIWQILGA